MLYVDCYRKDSPEFEFMIKINICGMEISTTIKLKTIDDHSLPYPQLVDFNLSINYDSLFGWTAIIHQGKSIFILIVIMPFRIHLSTIQEQLLLSIRNLVSTSVLKFLCLFPRLRLSVLLATLLLISPHIGHHLYNVEA